MWDEARQARLDQLRAVDTQARLTEPERAELATLLTERLQHEESALRDATARIQSENAAMEARLRCIEEQIIREER